MLYRPGMAAVDSGIWSWWRHQMEKISALLAICAGNSPVTGEFPTRRPVTRNFDVSFDLHLNKKMSKQKREAGDLRRHRAHFDAILIMLVIFCRNIIGMHKKKTGWIKFSKRFVDSMSNGAVVSDSEWLAWASYQIRKIAGCACAGNTGNVFPTIDFKGNC